MSDKGPKVPRFTMMHYIYQFVFAFFIVPMLPRFMWNIQCHLYFFSEEEPYWINLDEKGLVVGEERRDLERGLAAF